MDALPQDAEARREWLLRWAEAQEARMHGTQPLVTRGARAVRRTRMELAGIPKRLVRTSAPLAERVLDRRLHTSGRSVQPEHYDDFGRVAYEPSPWYVLPRALCYLGVSRRDTFVDFGCGKGRVVHQAARRPFRRVIGVEISPVLAEIARAGLAARRHQHRCQDVEVVVADAAEFRVPDDLTIGYLFHPLRGQTFAALLQRIVDSLDRRPRRVRLIYAAPLDGPLVLNTGRFRLLTYHRALFGIPGAGGDSLIGRTAIFESINTSAA